MPKMKKLVTGTFFLWCVLTFEQTTDQFHFGVQNSILTWHELSIANHLSHPLFQVRCHFFSGAEVSLIFNNSIHINISWYRKILLWKVLENSHFHTDASKYTAINLLWKNTFKLLPRLLQILLLPQLLSRLWHLLLKQVYTPSTPAIE
jgi:hypothetical protein